MKWILDLIQGTYFINFISKFYVNFFEKFIDSKKKVALSHFYTVIQILFLIKVIIIVSD